MSISEFIPTRRDRARASKEAEIRLTRRLVKRQSDLWSARRKREEIELPEPIRWGWERYWIVRPEIAHTSEAPTLAKVLAVAQKAEISNRRDFAARDWKRGGKKHPTEHRMRSIAEAKYWDEVDPSLRRYFEAVTYREKVRGSVRVEIRFEVKNVPARFVSRIRPYYLTHFALPPSEIDSELSMVEGALYGPGAFLLRHDIRGRGACEDRWGDNTVPPLVEPEDAAGLPARIGVRISGERLAS